MGKWFHIGTQGHFNLLNLSVLITCLLKMYGYYREMLKEHVSHFYKLKVSEVWYDGKSWKVPIEYILLQKIV